VGLLLVVAATVLGLTWWSLRNTGTDLMAGWWWVGFESSPGVGTTVRFTMPVTPTSARSERRDLSIEVPGTPEEVWEAIATGPGISSWFVGCDVEQRDGGGVTLGVEQHPVPHLD